MSEAEELECFSVLEDEEYGGLSIKQKVISAVADLKLKTRSVFLPGALDKRIREVTKSYVS